ncbi:MAG: hypothetical protein NW237_02645 [Cyanobacteriota bacterium]|nr:hypothetical protein [Cyanobacteriota bacterium]
MRRNDPLWHEFIHAVDSLHLAGPYFVEERVARKMGRFLRAVKDVPVGQPWWEIRYFFDQTEKSWAYLPEQQIDPQFAWGHTLAQAYLNGIFHLAEASRP